MILIRVIILFIALAIPSVHAETPKPMAKNVFHITQAAAILDVCFDSAAFEELDTSAALQLFKLEMRLIRVVERIANRYNDDALYLAFEITRVNLSSDSKFQQDAQEKYHYCGDLLFDDMEAYVSEIEVQINGFLGAE